MSQSKIILITGTRKGIGRHLCEHYIAQGHHVIGCSRKESDLQHERYTHHCLDVSDEKAVVALLSDIRKAHGSLDALINNAGVASMNHALLTSAESLQKIFNTNVLGSFLFCREAAKLMQKKQQGCIVNFTTVAVPLRLEGEAIYAASKAAVENLTQVLAKEFAPFGVRVNAIGPTPIETDLIRSVPQDKIDQLLVKQAIPRLGTFEDVAQVMDFYLSEKNDFMTGQILYLGGV